MNETRKEIDYFKTVMVYVIIFIIIYLAFIFMSWELYFSKDIRVIFILACVVIYLFTIPTFQEWYLPFYKKTKEEKIEKYKAKVWELQEELQILGEVHDLQQKIYKFKQK